MKNKKNYEKKLWKYYKIIQLCKEKTEWSTGTCEVVQNILPQMGYVQTDAHNKHEFVICRWSATITGRPKARVCTDTFLLSWLRRSPTPTTSQESSNWHKQRWVIPLFANRQLPVCFFVANIYCSLELCVCLSVCLSVCIYEWMNEWMNDANSHCSLSVFLSCTVEREPYCSSVPVHWLARQRNARYWSWFGWSDWSGAEMAAT